MLIIGVIALVAITHAHNLACADLTTYAANGWLDDLKECIDGIPDSDREFPFLFEELVAAACNHQYDVARWLVSIGVKSSVNRDDLVCAVGTNDVKMAKLLIEHDKNVPIMALFLAAANGNSETVDLTLEFVDDPNQTVRCYEPIRYAPVNMYENITDVVPTCTDYARMLIKMFHAGEIKIGGLGIDDIELNKDDDYDYNGPVWCSGIPLSGSAYRGELDKVKKCVERMSSDRDTFFLTDQLVAAACGGDYSVVEYLLEQRAVIDPRRAELQCASLLNHVNVVRLLLRYDNRGLSQPLLLAASNGHNAVSEVLMEYGADPTTVVYCYTPIIWAPDGSYDNVAAKLPMCKQFAETLNKEYAELMGGKEYKYRDDEIPGMGLLEDDDASREEIREQMKLNK